MVNLPMERIIGCISLGMETAAPPKGKAAVRSKLSDQASRAAPPKQMTHATNPTQLNTIPSTPRMKPADDPPLFLHLLPETVAMMASTKPMIAAMIVEERNAHTREIIP